MFPEQLVKTALDNRHILYSGSEVSIKQNYNYGYDCFDVKNVSLCDNICFKGWPF
jgi:hypothetical protein